MFAATPLEAHTVLTIIHYISPTIQPLPQHLVASQLAIRQSCLKLTPDDPSYLFWPSDDDQHVVDALESFQRKPMDDIRLDFPIRYTADEFLFAHVQLAPDEPTGLRIVFQWEEGVWKYSNAARMPFPPSSSASLDDLPESQPGDDGGEDTPDSYWDSYGEPEREEAAADLGQEQRETTGSYWDMYNSVQGSGDSVIPSPAAEKQRHDLHPIPFSYSDMHPATVHNPIDSLSERLEALSQRSLPAEEQVDIESLPLNINGTQQVQKVEEDGLKEILRGVYRLWKSTRLSALNADRELFLSVVQEVLAEQ
ncbi:hypothetical protein B0H10DRAFT_2061660 [Mycena sp. CBHHK59/15]|nr:hypothetical protein B0H10DRAFT_2061660 [Mycena sp. CBHHK59/15]